jgi:plastin-1
MLVLKNDENCKKYLPIDPDTNDVFKILVDGIILCKLINNAVPGTIDERVINKKENLNIFQINENLRLAINAAKAIGCQIIGIHPETIIEQKYPMILGLLWQIIKVTQIKFNHFS